MVAQFRFFNKSHFISSMMNGESICICVEQHAIDSFKLSTWRVCRTELFRDVCIMGNVILMFVRYVYHLPYLIYNFCNDSAMAPTSHHTCLPYLFIVTQKIVIGRGEQNAVYFLPIKLFVLFLFYVCIAM